MGPCTNWMFPCSFTTRKMRRPAITSTTISIWRDGCTTPNAGIAVPEVSRGSETWKDGYVFLQGRQELPPTSGYPWQFLRIFDLFLFNRHRMRFPVTDTKQFCGPVTGNAALILVGFFPLYTTCSGF